MTPPPRKPFNLAGASRRWWLVLVVLICASAAAYLGRVQAPAEPSRLEGRTMGTTWRVVLGRALEPEALAALKADVETELAAVNRSMSTYDPESELSRFNRALTTEPVAISPELAHVMDVSLRVFQGSGGTFDVTVMPLVNAWGFGPRGAMKAPPTDDEIAALLARVGSGKLVREGNTLRKTVPDVQVDLSAVAKGHGVDRVADLLLARGLGDHLVEIGGEVRVVGHAMDGRAWRVGIEEPDPEKHAVRLAVDLPAGALATSGNYRNFTLVNGVKHVHTLDPATGKPVQHTLLSASVMSPTCEVADAWATALMAAGPQRAWEMAQREKLDVLLMEAGPGGKVVERMTDAFRARVVPRER